MNNNLIKLTNDLADEISNGNIEIIMSFLDSEVMCAGLLRTRFIAEYDDIELYLKAINNKNILFEQKNFYIAYKNDDIGVIIGICTIRLQAEHKVLSGIWLSLLWKHGESSWKVNYMHMSDCFSDKHNKKICQTNETSPYGMIDYANDYIQMNSKLVVDECKGNMYFVSLKDIIYIEAFNVKSCIYTKEGSIEYSAPMFQLEKKLPGQFMRIHRSYIINIMYVTGIKRYEIELCNKIKLSIPEKKYKKIKEAIKDKEYKMYR